MSARLVLLPAVLALLATTARAHGGAYRGPGDVSPPSGGGAAPASGSDARGATSTPTGPGPAAPRTGANAPAAVPTVTGSAIAEPDASVWQLWWGYNNAAYLDVKGAVHSSDLLQGSTAFFLGRRPADRTSDRLIPSREVIAGRVVPALERVLDEERDADMVTGALIALAKIGEIPGRSPTSASLIARFLSDDNQEIAETAAVSLGILADQGSVPTLKALLFDRPAARELIDETEVPWRTRAFAAYGLGLIGNQVEDETLREEIVRTLASAVTTGSVLELATPDVAVACLSAIGLVPLSADDAGGAGGIGASGRARQIDWLLELGRRGDLDDRVRAHLPTAVARLLVDTPPAWTLERRVAQAWIEDLSDRSETPRVVQQSSVLALGRLGDPGDTPTDRAVHAALVHASLTSRNVEVRRFALIALAQVGARAGESESERAVFTEIREHLTQRLRKGHGGERAWAALALGVLGRDGVQADARTENEIDALLLDALERARAPRDVGACAIACGIRGQDGASTALLAKLDEVRDDEARGYVTLALGMTGAVEALEPIQDLVRASKYRPALLRQAAISLGLLGDKDIVPELIEMLERASSLSAQASIAHGLGAVGDARSIDPLIEMLGDPDVTPRARAFAAVALGIVSDKESEPWNAKLSIGVNYRANTTTLTDGRGAGILEIL
jgi:HEAT repeat protein